MTVKHKILIAGGFIVTSALGMYLYQQYKMTDYLCYSAKKFKILKLGINNSTIGMDMVINNKGKLEVDLRKIKIDIYANGIFIGTVNQDALSAIKPHSSTEFPITISFNPREVLSNVSSIISSSALNNVEWKFKGNVKVLKFGIPLMVPLNFKYTTQELMKEDPKSIC